MVIASVTCDVAAARGGVQPEKEPLQERATVVVRAWAEACARTPYAELLWRVETQVLEQRGGDLVDEFLLDEAFLYRWPDCYLLRARVVREQFTNLDKARRLDRDVSINARGEHLDHALLRGVFEARMGESLHELTGQHAVHAPHLLGLWIDNAEADAFQAELLPDGRVQCFVPALKHRFSLAPIPASSEPVWGVDRIEFVRSSGEVATTWHYDEFVVPSGFSVAMGTVRLPVSADPAAQAGPRATLQRAGSIDRPPDDRFELDLDRAVTMHPRTGLISDSSGNVIGKGRPTTRTGVLGGWAPWLAGAAGLGVLIGGGLHWRRMRA